MLLRGSQLFYLVVHQLIHDVGQDTRGRFHQHFMCSFYSHRSHKGQNTFKLSVSFALLGPEHVKAVCKMLVKLTLDAYV